VLNKALLIGNLGKDPELRFTTAGKAVCNFSVATSESYTDAQGQKVEKTDWHNVVVWEKQAENCKKYLSKGSKVFVEGKIQTREWEDKQGGKRYTTEIVAQTVKFLSSPRDRESPPDSEPEPAAPAKESSGPVKDSGLPF